MDYVTAIGATLGGSVCLRQGEGKTNPDALGEIYQLRRSDPQGIGYLADVHDSDVTFTALNAADVGTVESRLKGQLLL